MIKKIALAVVIVIAAVLAFAATKPDTFSVERSTSIKATPEKIHPLINDFHNWTQWSPWENLDPNISRTYSGAASGVGTAYAWTGNGKVGTGRMEITESTPAKITLKLDFLKPMENHCVTEYTLTPKGDVTEVTWSMHGPNKFMGKVFSVFMSMDKMVGKEFENGLANLKAAAEK